jgi:hypothetical protein
MEKHFFCNKKLETPFGNIVCHGKMHLCAKYGHIIMNYAMENEAAKKWRKKNQTFAECPLGHTRQRGCTVSFPSTTAGGDTCPPPLPNV